MSQKTPVAKKSTVIPGYQGYRPRIHVNNHHLGKTMAEQARDVFKTELDTPVNALASTGFNARTMSRVDEQLHATSRRYGKSTMLATAKNFQPIDYATTTFRDSFKSPFVAHNRPNWRTRDATQKFDDSRIHEIKNKTSAQLASGYSSNRQLWDGTSWATEPNQHTDQVRTLYRQGFNQPKPFHKSELRNNNGRLKLREKVFDTIDK